MRISPAIASAATRREMPAIWANQLLLKSSPVLGPTLGSRGVVAVAAAGDSVTVTHSQGLYPHSPQQLQGVLLQVSQVVADAVAVGGGDRELGA